MVKKHTLTLFVVAALLLVSACKNKCDGGPDCYEVPASYVFENVNYSGQTTRLDMLDELSDYMSAANTMGVALDSATLRDMYANQNAPFSDAALNSSDKNLKDKTYSLDVALISAYLDSLAVASQSTVVGANGTAGVVTSSTDPSKAYLLSAKGVDYAQMVKKGLMGALIYYQIAGVYLSDDKIGETVDNETVTAGEGTAMEHHWDEAFGYFGVPVDYPSNVSGLRYIGEYCQELEGVLGLSTPLMDAFILGRAAISNDDMTTKNAQVVIIGQNLEKLFAAAGIHYLNEAKSHFGDDALRGHELSEGWGFIQGLKYNPNRTITDNEIQTILDFIGDDFYNVTLAGLDSARDFLATKFGLESVKDAL